MDSAITVTREQLVSLALRAPDRIEGYRVVIAPGGSSGLHHHVGGVVGVVIGGTARYERDGVVQALAAGDAFDEPAGETITRFDNASTTEPLTFIAFYPLRGDMDLLTPGEAPRPPARSSAEERAGVEHHVG